LGEKSTFDKINTSCWKHFDCPDSCKNNCPAYKKGSGDDKFCECWLFIDDNLKGGPKRNGPCASCEWLLKHTSNFSIQ
jgi:hypothetical protein